MNYDTIETVTTLSGRTYEVIFVEKGDDFLCILRRGGYPMAKGSGIEEVDALKDALDNLLGDGE